VIDISTHDQILGGPSGQIYLGCTFPARDDYRRRLIEAAGASARCSRATGREPLRR